MARRLVLLPGLGADERLFAQLGELCLPTHTPRLPVPNSGENMLAYALRVAATLELKPDDWIGGCSFGSLVAADIARHRPVAGLVLIGGALSSSDLTAPAAWASLLRHVLPVRALHPLLTSRALLSLAFGALPADTLSVLASMLADTSDAMLREGVRLVTSYDPSTQPLCPVYSIHGGNDRFMRPPTVPNCIVVEEAGHALVLSHAQRVTGFLRTTICR
jgi:hypothetical protein